ncbi:MAG: serine hydrolase [Sediminibacterium sp.]|nr:serine hydrolase [Sediminibacterium sp.]
MRMLAFIFVLFVHFAALKAQVNPLDSILTNTPALKQFIVNKDSLRIQIVYTQINRNRNNKPSFTEYRFNVDNNNYFYPASCVKMPIAFLALEKLNELKINGLDRNSTMITDSSAPLQDVVYTLPEAIDSRPSIENYIQQVFLVSSNDAFNRLYEFLGQDYIQQKLSQKGYPDAIVRHRLSISRSSEQNAITNGIRFFDTSGNLLYQQAPQFSKAQFPLVNTALGKGYMANGQLVNQPFSFATKNRIYLTDMHHMLQSVLFPKQFSKKQRFLFSADDDAFIKKWMSYYAGNDSSSSNKILYYGSGDETANRSIRIFNKTGGAYGFLLDVTYVMDTVNKIEYMLSAVISCNQDGIYNDDKYDYNSIGYPFMKNLGRAVHGFEIERKRKNRPNFSSLQFNY